MVDLHGLLAPLVDAAGPPPEVDVLRGRVGTRRRRRVRIQMAAVLLLLGIGTAFAVAIHETPDPAVVVDEPVPPVVTIPDGWQTVAVGRLQLAVPGDWTVSTTTCGDLPVNLSHTVFTVEAGCSMSQSPEDEIGIGIFPYSLLTGHGHAVPDPDDPQGLSPSTINGLHVLVCDKDGIVRCVYIPELAMGIDIFPWGGPPEAADPVEVALSRQIVSTISVAPPDGSPNG